MTTFPEHVQEVVASLVNQPMTLTGLTQVINGLSDLWEMEHPESVLEEFSSHELAKTCYVALPANFQA